MTTRDQNIQKIRDACVAANPSKFWAVGLTPKDDCRLADVLLAIEKHFDDYIHESPLDAPILLQKRNQTIGCLTTFAGTFKWDLRHDDLTLQSDELLAFVAEIV